MYLYINYNIFNTNEMERVSAYVAYLKCAF